MHGRLLSFILVASSLTLCLPALVAEVTPTRSWTTLVSSNGWGAVVVDLVPRDGKAPLHHFREHLYAAEEPRLDGAGNEVWIDGAPQAILSRDLLYDVLVGLRAKGEQTWLKEVAIDLDASAYVPYTSGVQGGTPIIRLVQRHFGLTITQYVYAPWGLDRASFVLLIEVENSSAAAIDGVSLFTLHNFHLGAGRPGPTGELETQGETRPPPASPSAASPGCSSSRRRRRRAGPGPITLASPPRCGTPSMGVGRRTCRSRRTSLRCAMTGCRVSRETSGGSNLGRAPGSASAWPIGAILLATRRWARA